MPTISAYDHKNNNDPYFSYEVQKARNALTCTCGHPNVSHAYTTDDTLTWPDGSGIGLGPCGNGTPGKPCPCKRFVDPAPTSQPEKSPTMPTTPANLTPYDTGDILEPKVWPTAPNTPKRYGYVDFENDSGETQFTVRIVPTDNGHRLEIDNYRSGALDVRIIQ